MARAQPGAGRTADQERITTMQTVSDHEVIVVGAGPGGATAATALAQRGHDVLLIDRHTFPRDKICGDAISLAASAS